MCACRFGWLVLMLSILIVRRIHMMKTKTRSRACGLHEPLIHDGFHVIVTLMVLSSSGRERERLEKWS
jgi:hypothetical protein